MLNIYTHTLSLKAVKQGKIGQCEQSLSLPCSLFQGGEKFAMVKIG